MKRLTIPRKEPFYLGLLLVVAGIFLKRLIELTLTADAHIESPRYLAIIYGGQLLLIALWIFLVIKQPATKLPSKTNLALVAFSLMLTFLMLEGVARLWLAFLATPDQRDEYVLY